MSEYEKRFSGKQMKYLETGINAQIDIPLHEVNGPNELRPYYTKVSNLCILHRYDIVNAFLKNVIIEESSELVIMGFARLTYIYKEHLPYWDKYVIKVTQELRDRGEDADGIMRGLIPRATKGETNE